MKLMMTFVTLNEIDKITALMFADNLILISTEWIDYLYCSIPSNTYTLI